MIHRRHADWEGETFWPIPRTYLKAYAPEGQFAVSAASLEKARKRGPKTAAHNKRVKSLIQRLEAAGIK